MAAAGAKVAQSHEWSRLPRKLKRRDRLSARVRAGVTWSAFALAAGATGAGATSGDSRRRGWRGHERTGCRGSEARNRWSAESSRCNVSFVLAVGATGLMMMVGGAAGRATAGEVAAAVVAGAAGTGLGARAGAGATSIFWLATGAAGGGTAAFAAGGEIDTVGLMSGAARVAPSRPS